MGSTKQGLDKSFISSDIYMHSAKPLSISPCQDAHTPSCHCESVHLLPGTELVASPSLVSRSERKKMESQLLHLLQSGGMWQQGAATVGALAGEVKSPAKKWPTKHETESCCPPANRTHSTHAHNTPNTYTHTPGLNPHNPPTDIRHPQHT